MILYIETIKQFIHVKWIMENSKSEKRAGGQLKDLSSDIKKSIT